MEFTPEPTPVQVAEPASGTVATTVIMPDEIAQAGAAFCLRAMTKLTELLESGEAGTIATAVQSFSTLLHAMSAQK